MGQGREMETMLEFLVVLPSAVMVAIGAVRAVLDGSWDMKPEWHGAHTAPGQAARLVLVHDSAREKLLRSDLVRPGRAAGRLRLVYNGG